MQVSSWDPEDFEWRWEKEGLGTHEAGPKGGRGEEGSEEEEREDGEQDPVGEGGGGGPGVLEGEEGP